MKTALYLLTGLFALAGACNARAQAPATPVPFRLPDIPAVLTAPEDRAAYLSVHYWDHFDFKDPSLIERAEVTEQAFVDFISILPYAGNAPAAVDTLYRRAAADRRMLDHFITLGDKYLYEPNSPMHNEELYILVLRAQLANPALSRTEKIRPRYLLELALKNRPGDPAADFTFLRRDGSRGRMSEIGAPYLLLYFNDPECDDCRRVKRQLAESPVLNRRLEDGRLRLLSIDVTGGNGTREQGSVPPGWIDGCDEGEQLTRKEVYDLKAMPTLYLLDAQKRVVLKDTTPERIEEYLVREAR